MKKFSLMLLCLIVFLAGCGYVILLNITGTPEAVAKVSEYQVGKIQTAQKNETFKVLTLNIAHGRSESYHQALLTTPKIRTNLDDIIELLNREQADIVALQEADGPSFWSGRFNHVAYIARNSGYSHSIQGANVDGLGLSYGTGLLSKGTISAPLAITFKPSPPTLTKGFTVATVRINDELEVDVVSVHLDFFSQRVRLKQIKSMSDQLAGRSKPLIIMGDFNNEWGENLAPQVLSTQLNLSTYLPSDLSFVTFPPLNSRIDYILISKELEFINHTILADKVSDHFGVLAEIKLKEK